MYAVAIGQALGMVLLLLTVALVIVWLGRSRTNQRAVHGAAALVALVLALSLGAAQTVPLYLAVYASAHVAFVLQWTYRRAERMPPSGFARLYAVFAGLLLVIAGTIAGGWYWDTTARMESRRMQSANPRIVDPYDQHSPTNRRSDVHAETPSDTAQTSSTPAELSRSGRIQWDDYKPVDNPAASTRSNRQEAAANPFAKYGQVPAPVSATSSVTDAYSDWEQDPWTGAGIAGGFLWLICLVRFLTLWIWRGFRHS
jgi:hypothetical protein